MVDFSWSALVDQGKAMISKEFDDIKSTGVPAIKASLEQWGANVLTEQANKSKKELASAVREIAKTPPAKGSFAEAAGSIASDVGLQNYGPMIAVAAVALVILGVIWGKK